MVQKTSNFSKFMMCSQLRTYKGEGGLSQSGQFANKVKGVKFSRFCADILLWNVESVNVHAIGYIKTNI